MLCLFHYFTFSTSLVIGNFFNFYLIFVKVLPLWRSQLNCRHRTKNKIRKSKFISLSIWIWESFNVIYFLQKNCNFLLHLKTMELKRESTVTSQAMTFYVLISRLLKVYSALLNSHGLGIKEVVILQEIISFS